MDKKIKVIIGLIILELILIFGICSYINTNISRGVKLDLDPGVKEDLTLVEEELEEKNQARIESVRLLAVGDAMFHMPQLRGAYFNGTYDFNRSFAHIKKYTEASDISIINFETVAGGKDLGYSGYPSFNSPDETLQAIKNAGFNIVNTANNHILDKRRQGLLNTLIRAEELGLKNLGTSRPNGKKYLIETVKDIKLGFLSYTYGCNGMENSLGKEELAGLINIIDEDLIKKDLESLKAQVDFLIVYIHWGDEYQRLPNKFQRDLGEKIFSWGGDIILGSHPHVVQGVERKTLAGEDKFIIYSLGNFISNQREELMKTPTTEDGLILTLDLEKDFSSNRVRIKNVGYIPTWVNKYYLDKRWNYEVLPIMDILNSREEKYKNIENKLRSSYNRTMDVINKNN